MLNFHREGSGESLVLIHGIAHHWQGWSPVIPYLARQFEVVAVDSPGFGESADLPAGEPQTMQRYTVGYEAFFAELSLERPHVAGNSMGGGIALELARRGKVRSATAISPAGFWTGLERHWVRLVLGTYANLPLPLRPAARAAVGTTAGRIALGRLLFAHPERMPPEVAVSTLENTWRSGATNPTLAALDSYEFEAGHELADAVVTIAWGSKDRLLFFSRQQPRAQGALPHARHVVMGDVGHTPTYDDPALIAEIIKCGTLYPR